ncbi:MAG: hypothetical protein Q9195_007504 [Heterodermia aff. obscurata]
MDSSPEDMRRRIASLELDVASLEVQRDFQTERKEEYMRNATTFERESIMWRGRATSMKEERNNWQRAAVDEMRRRHRSDHRALQELVALNDQVGALRQSSGASIDRLQTMVRHLEGRLSIETRRGREEGDRLRHDNDRLKAMLTRNGSVIERLQQDSPSLQGETSRHGATGLRQLHQLNEHRNEIADLIKKLERTTGRLENSTDLTDELLAELEDAYTLEMTLKEQRNSLVEIVRALSEENRRLKGQDSSSTARLDDSTSRPPGESSASRPASRVSRRGSIQADAELAEIDARLERAFYNGSNGDDSGYEAAEDSESENSGRPVDGDVPAPERQADEIRLRPLRRMRLPPLPAGSAFEAIESEEPGEDSRDSSPVLVLRGGLLGGGWAVG